MSTVPDPSWVGIGLAALPMVGCMAVLAAQRFGQEGRIAWAATRMVLQLLLLTVILRWVFTREGGWVVVLVAVVMLLTSAHTVGGRFKRHAWRIRAESFLAMAIGATTVMAVAVFLTLRLEPWHQPRVVIPLLGMILGNSVTAVALAVERLESELRSGRDQVEMRLALGASPRQAAHPALRAAVQAALSPVINSMAIAGIVAIPGMSTGQILAGMDVGVALRYQMLVYLGITGTVAISTLVLLAIRLRSYFTPAEQLRLDP